MMRRAKISTGFGRRLMRTGFFALVLAASAVYCCGQRATAPQSRPGGSAPRSVGSGMNSQSRSKPSPAIPLQSQPPMNSRVGPVQQGARPAYQPGRPSYQPVRPGMQPGVQPGARPGSQPGARMSQPAYQPGQGHLPAWWAAHRGMSPNQQADALRREPGFRDLPSDQQQRLINRLHNFDSRSPVEQQRLMQRNEMFERLSPERQQDVRGAAQALAHMPPDRQATIRHAFQQLRGMPPDERQRMLGSAYGSQFSPQERTVLGNMLSIEPYQPRVYQPYFGR